MKSDKDLEDLGKDVKMKNLSDEVTVNPEFLMALVMELDEDHAPEIFDECDRETRKQVLEELRIMMDSQYHFERYDSLYRLSEYEKVLEDRDEVPPRDLVLAAKDFIRNIPAHTYEIADLNLSVGDYRSNSSDTLRHGQYIRVDKYVSDEESNPLYIVADDYTQFADRGGKKTVGRSIEDPDGICISEDNLLGFLTGNEEDGYDYMESSFIIDSFDGVNLYLYDVEGLVDEEDEDEW